MSGYIPYWFDVKSTNDEKKQIRIYSIIGSIKI